MPGATKTTRTKKKAARPKAKIYLFKVSLAGRPRTWRQIAIAGDQTLDDLHWAIFHAFDREEEHLYSFYLPRPGDRGQARLRRATEYTHPDAAEEEPEPAESAALATLSATHRAQLAALGFDLSTITRPRRALDASRATIDSLGLRTGRKFIYIFDFGDSWEHDLEVESTDAPRERGRYPRILASRGKSPPQYPDDPDYL